MYIDTSLIITDSYPAWLINSIQYFYISYPVLSRLILCMCTAILCYTLLPELTQNHSTTTSNRPQPPAPAPYNNNHSNSLSSSSSTKPPSTTRQLSLNYTTNESNITNGSNHMPPVQQSTHHNDTADVSLTDDPTHQLTSLSTPQSVRMSYSNDQLDQDMDNSSSNNNELHDTQSDQVQLMCNGATFLKFGRFGKPHPRRVTMRMMNNQLQLYWQTGTLLVDQIIDVVAGKQTSVYNRRENRDADPNLCFSIVTKKRTLDLQCDTTIQRDLWVNGIKRLANIYDSPHQQQRDTSSYSNMNQNNNLHTSSTDTNSTSRTSYNTNNVVNVSSSSNQYITAVLNQYPSYQQHAVQIALTQSQFPNKPKHSRIGSLSNKLYSTTRTRNRSISNNNSQLIDNTSAHTPRISHNSPYTDNSNNNNYVRYSATQPLTDTNIPSDSDSQYSYTNNSHRDSIKYDQQPQNNSPALSSTNHS